MPKFLICAAIALALSLVLARCESIVAQELDPEDPFGAPLPGFPTEQPADDPFGDPFADALQNNRPAPQAERRAPRPPAAASDKPAGPRAVSGEKEVREALEQRLDLVFIENPLADVAEYLRNEIGVNVDIDSRALEDAGLGSDTPVTIHVKGLKVRDGLRLILCQHHLVYDIRDGALRITTPDAAEDNLFTTVYPVGHLITRDADRHGFHGHGEWTLDDLFGVLETNVRPEQWETFGGPASMEGVRGMLVVSATLAMQEDVAECLAALEDGVAAAEKSPHEPPAAVSFPQPDPKSDEQKILDALEKKFDFDHIETPLQDVVENLADQAGIPILLDHRALEEVGIGSDSPVTRLLKGVSLRSGLRMMLREMDLTFVVRDGVLFLTTPEYEEQELIVRVLPVNDLVLPDDDVEALELMADGPASGDYESLIELITTIVRPTTWEEVGGPGAIDAYRGCLVFSQTEETFHEIYALLAGLRKIHAQTRAARRDGKPWPTEIYRPREGESPAHAKLRAKLEADVGMHVFKKSPLQDVIDALKDHCHVEMQIDHKALEEVGVGTDTPITLSLGGESLANALRRLLRELDLTWVVRDEVILITTHEGCESMLVTVLYPVGDLVEIEYENGQSSTDYESLIETITSTVHDTSWEEVGGAGAITEHHPCRTLAISQTDQVHDAIAKLLADLRAAQAKQKVSTDAARPAGEAKEVLRNKAGERLHLRVYRFFNPKVESPQEWATAIAELVEPASWKSGEPYVLRPITGAIVVRHTAEVHRAIHALLTESFAILPVGSGLFAVADEPPAKGTSGGLGSGVIGLGSGSIGGPSCTPPSYPPSVCVVRELSLAGDDASPAMSMYVYHLPASTEKAPRPTAEEIAPLVREVLHSANWQAEGAYLKHLNHRLLVRQQAAVQRDVLKLLVELRVIDPPRSRGKNFGCESVVPVVGSRHGDVH